MTKAQIKIMCRLAQSQVESPRSNARYNMLRLQRSHLSRRRREAVYSKDGYGIKGTRSDFQKKNVKEKIVE